MFKLWLYSPFLYHVNHNVIVALLYIHLKTKYGISMNLYNTYVTLCTYNIIGLMSYELWIMNYVIQQFLRV